MKNHLSQLEMENRRLQINYTKLRKINLEKLDMMKRSENFVMMGSVSQDEQKEDKYFKKASVSEWAKGVEHIEAENADERN